MCFADIDECELETEEPICGNNSKCSNKIGGHACPCCQGYQKDDNGTCIGKLLPFSNFSVIRPETNFCPSKAIPKI